jgi:hypothetical protein
MDLAEGLERMMPKHHRAILLVAVSGRSRANGPDPCPVPRPHNAPKRASGALEPAAAPTKVHNTL